MCSAIFATALSHLAPQSAANALTALTAWSRSWRYRSPRVRLSRLGAPTSAGRQERSS
jgi:hypothetical protein